LGERRKTTLIKKAKQQVKKALLNQRGDVLQTAIVVGFLVALFVGAMAIIKPEYGTWANSVVNAIKGN
jgi:hypothetical protein